MLKSYALALPDMSRNLALPLMTLKDAQAAQATLAKAGKSVLVVNVNAI